MLIHILSLFLAFILAGEVAPFAAQSPSAQPISPDVSQSEPSDAPMDTPVSSNTDDIPYEESVPALFSYFTSYDFSKPVPECSEVDNSYFADAAFVGDSRTEGFYLYSKVKQGKLISYTGLTVFGAVGAKVINVNGTKCTVPEALATGSYSKVYLSFGVNELGYRDTESFYRTYCQLIDSIRATQPNAIIYVQTLIPVNDQRAAATGHGRYVNCQRIQEFNEVIARVANDKRVPLLDLFSAFVVDGQLPLEASRDGVHLVPEYCEKQLDFYRRHAIPTEAFADIASTASSAVQTTTPVPSPAQSAAPAAPTTSQQPSAVPPAPESSAAPESPAESDSSAAPVPPANEDGSTPPTAPADPANPVQPANPPAVENQTAPEAPTT